MSQYKTYGQQQSLRISFNSHTSKKCIGCITEYCNLDINNVQCLPVYIQAVFCPATKSILLVLTVVETTTFALVISAQNIFGQKQNTVVLVLCLAVETVTYTLMIVMMTLN